MTTIIVGDVDRQKALKLLAENFSFNKRTCKKPLYGDEPPQTEARYVEQKGNFATGFLIFGYHGAKAKNLKDTIILDILSIILGEGKSSRLYQNLIEKPSEPVFNVVGADQYQFKDGNTFFIQGNFSPAKKDKAVELIKNEVNSVVEATISDNELIKAKKKLKVRFAQGAETVSEIGENIGYYMTVCDDLSLCSDYLKILEDISPLDVQQSAKQYLGSNKATISVLLPETSNI